MKHRISVECSLWTCAFNQVCWLVILAVGVGISTNALRGDGLPIVTDRSLVARLTVSPGKSLLITLEEARGAHNENRALFIDARSSDEFGSGHVRGAINLTWLDFDTRGSAFLKDVPKDKLIVTYCDGEHCDLSKELAQMLIGAGFNNVRVLVNGWTVWKGSGLPVE